MEKHINLINHILTLLPEIIIRSKVKELTNGLVSPGTLANCDSKGTGPEDRFLINGKVAYTRTSLLKWLDSRVSRGSCVSKRTNSADLFLNAQATEVSRHA